MSTSYAAERAAAERAAREAGDVLRRYYGSALDVAHKGAGSPVTKADLEANAAIEKALRGAFPEDGWLSEETADSRERLSRRRVWIVDPLDGTKEFISGVPEFCVSIALVDRERPVVAVLYNPAAERLLSAERGAGASVNGRVAAVTRRRALQGAVTLASRTEDARGEWGPFRKTLDVRLTGSVAFKLGQVASGEADLTFTLTPKNEWDICGGALLVEEAGGRVTDPDGGEVRFNQPQTLRPGLIASNGALHDPVLALIRQARGACK